MGVRASPLLWSADGKGLDAAGQPDGQGNHVVGGSDVFRRCPDAGRALRVEIGRSRQQAVSDLCGVLGNRNVGQQLEEPQRRLFEGAPRPRPWMTAFVSIYRLWHFDTIVSCHWECDNGG